MTVYLLHLDPPLKHARHYIGFTARTAEERLGDHLAGRGASMIAAAVKAGSKVTLARVWPEAGRDFERWLKEQRCSKRWCAHCSGERYATPTPEKITDRFRASKRTYVENYA